MKRATFGARAAASLAALSLTSLVVTSLGCGAPSKAAKGAQIIFQGDSRALRQRAPGAAPNSPGHPAILFLAFDGVDRSLIYDMLKRGELPALGELLGGLGGGFAHAHFDETLLSTLPSSTMAAWTTAMSGVPPARHGVTGNEFFMREVRKLGAPAPVSFDDSKPTLSIYTDGYLDALRGLPSVYDRMRQDDPDVLIWVAVHQIYSGADLLLLTKPTLVAHAFEHVVEEAAGKLANKKPSRDLYAAVDKDVVSVVIKQLETGPVPDVLTVYLSGTDLYAHIAAEGPDEARRAYLKEVADPALGQLAAALHARNALDDRYVVLTSDHGHTQVLHDDVHALSTKGPEDPPALVKKAGYRLRPFQLEVDDKADFDAVYAPGGAMAYLYVADRSTCPKEKTPCDWTRPPRYEEDVLPLAEAFYKNNEDGALAPKMKGTLDLVLTRRPRPFAEDDLPFEVYVGQGRTVPVEAYLKEHPHPTYVDVLSRLRDLGVGSHGERAGDVLLLAHNGDRDDVRQRYYFADLYRSWHGSPSRKDSEIPLIVAHAHHASAELGAQVARVLGGEPHQQKVTDLLLALRQGKTIEPR